MIRCDGNTAETRVSKCYPQQDQILQNVHEVQGVRWDQTVHLIHLFQQVRQVLVAPRGTESKISVQSESVKYFMSFSWFLICPVGTTRNKDLIKALKGSSRFSPSEVHSCLSARQTDRCFYHSRGQIQKGTFPVLVFVRLGRTDCAPCYLTYVISDIFHLFCCLTFGPLGPADPAAPESPAGPCQDQMGAVQTVEQEDEGN